MNFKKVAPQAVESFDEPTTDVVLTIEGLIPSHDGTFTLRGVNLVPIDYQPTIEALANKGLSDRDIDALVEDFAQTVFELQVSKLLAQRTKRVG